jgi:glycosyltransferase involved in cell wall biosynthesis
VLRLAWFSPLPPQRTGVADYCAGLLPYLAAEAKVTLFVSDPAAVDEELRARFPLRPQAAFARERWRYDMALYHLGNSLFHQEIYAALRCYPGVTVLHELVLHNLIARTTVEAGDFAAYAREVAYEQGTAGVARARQAQRQGASLSPFEWPLCGRAVDASVGLIVHSQAARQALLARHPLARVAHIDHFVCLPPLPEAEAARARLGLPADAFIVATCGYLAPHKRLDVVLAAFARLRRRHADALWLLAGEPAPGCGGLEEEIGRAGLGGAVRQLGYLPLDGLWDALAAADVCVSLRQPTAGEASGSVLRAMALGRPTIVSEVGWYAELPADTCVRIRHDGTEVEQLADWLERWYHQEEERRQFGQRARAYVARACAPERIARQYVDFVAEVLAALGSV